MRQPARSLIVLILIGALTACGLPGSANRDAAVQTAVIETSIAQATSQSATYEAAQGTPTTIPLPATVTPEPAVDPYTLSEEELAALIGANYEDAIFNSSDAGEMVQETTSDNLVTDDEIYNVFNYVYDAEASINSTLALITQYEEVYGEFASQSIDQLIAIEQDLNQLSATMSEIEALLVQGSAAASESIGKLNEITSGLQVSIDDALANKQTWRETLQNDLNSREQRYASLPATEIAADRDGAILQVYAYLDSIKAAFQDRKVSMAEMDTIAQLAANAKASLQAQGGPALQVLGNSIDGFTRQISRGQWPQAQNGIGNFEGSLPQRP